MGGPCWTKLASSPNVQRSSHTLSVVGNNIYIFGGELKPREPVDSNVVTLNWYDARRAAYMQKHGPANQEDNPLDREFDPAMLDDDPRAQEAMRELYEEHRRDFRPAPRFNQDRTPQMLSIAGEAPQPRVGSASTVLKDKIYIFSGRGGTAMAPIEEHGALWSFDPSAKAWSRVEPSDSGAPYPEGRSYHAMASDGVNTIYVHAGCPEKGRLDDLWSFNVKERKWTRLASAPAPARGGSSIVFADRFVYRMHGFDGETEQGGKIDRYYPRDDEWMTETFSPDGREGPSSRSVCALLAFEWAGSWRLLTLFGESESSSQGHAGAGKMCSDVWIYDPERKRWLQVPIEEGEAPAGRGWFDAVAIPGKDAIIVSGGLSKSNERLDDVWALEMREGNMG